MPSWKVTNRASITNRPAWTVGGLGPSVGPGAWATRAIQVNANGQGPFRFRTFCINQLGNIGGGVRNSMFGSSSDSTNGCRDQPCVKAPYCVSGGKSLARTEHTLTIGSTTTGSPIILMTGYINGGPTGPILGSLKPKFAGLFISFLYLVTSGAPPTMSILLNLTPSNVKH